MIRCFAAARSLTSRLRLCSRFSYKERVSDEFLHKLVTEAPPVRPPPLTPDPPVAPKPARHKKNTPENSPAAKPKPTRRSKAPQTETLPADQPPADQPPADSPAQSDTPALSRLVETVMEEQEEQGGTKRIPKQHEVSFEKVQILSEEKRLIESRYGVLRVPNQIRFAKLSNIYYLVNSTNVKFIKRVLKNDSGALLLFPPVSPAEQHTHEKNARLIFEAIKKILFDSYYGQKSGNPFRNCKAPSDIFHMARRISLEISMQLRKIGVVCTATGDVLLKGEQHKILDMEALSNSAHFLDKSGQPGSEVVSPDTAEKFYKRDLFLPVVDLLSTVSQQNLQIEGVKVEALNGKKLYCRRGVGAAHQVWPPTHDRLFKLFKSFIDEKAFFMKEVKGVLEVGCGSGVLSFIALQLLNKKEKVHCFDLNLEAVKTVQMNKNILDLQDRVNEFKADVNMLATFDDSQFEYFAKSHQ